MIPFVLNKQLELESVLMRNLPLSQVRLHNQRTIPWLILVPRVPDVAEIHHLNIEERALFIEEIAQASRALETLYAPDKINVGALGNVVPQLHVHVVARFKRDPAWPGAVWGKFAPEPYSLPAVAEIRTKLNEDALWR